MPSILLCPRCRKVLQRARSRAGLHWHCPECGGSGVGSSVLRRTTKPEVWRDVWMAARQEFSKRGLPCPVCEQAASVVHAGSGPGSVDLDVCTRCAFVWLDAGELEHLPRAPAPPPSREGLSPRARAALAVAKASEIGERGWEEDESAPSDWRQVLAGLLGLPVEEEVEPLKRTPSLTWTLVGCTVLASLMAFPQLRLTVEQLGLIPRDPWRLGGITFITSFLLHGGIFHLLANMYFLAVFGDNVEDVLGKGRFLFLVLLSALAGDALHIAMDPHSSIPLIGASAGVSGVITFYALRFPKARLAFWFWMFFIPIGWVRMRAWTAFLLWIGLQALGAFYQLGGFGGVSYLGHLGGALVGLTFWALWRLEPKGF